MKMRRGKAERLLTNWRVGTFFKTQNDFRVLVIDEKTWWSIISRFRTTNAT